MMTWHVLTEQGEPLSPSHGEGGQRVLRVGVLRHQDGRADVAWPGHVSTLDTSAHGRAEARSREGAGHSDHVTSPMQARVLSLDVAEGDAVTLGQTLMVLEAMKMEHPVRAPRAGRVRTVHAQAQALVAYRAVLVTLEAEPSR